MKIPVDKHARMALMRNFRASLDAAELERQAQEAARLRHYALMVREALDQRAKERERLAIAERRKVKRAEATKRALVRRAEQAAMKAEDQARAEIALAEEIADRERREAIRAAANAERLAQQKQRRAAFLRGLADGVAPRVPPNDHCACIEVLSIDIDAEYAEIVIGRNNGWLRWSYNSRDYQLGEPVLVGADFLEDMMTARGMVRIEQVAR